MSSLIKLIVILTLSVGLCAQTGQIEPKPGEDLIVLRAGERLTGKIVKETADYIELKMGLGTFVGFEKSRVVRITRGTRGKGESKPAPPALKAGDDWYVLYDGEGHCVGRLHSSIVVNERGEFRIAEEWQFVQKDKVTHLSFLEVVDRKLSPISCFYHERSHREPGKKLTHERLIQGKVENGRLVVQRRTLGSRERKSYGFPRGTRFRLALMHELRQSNEQRIHEAFESVYDPAREEFYRLRLASRPRRRVEWHGKTIEVRELMLEVGEVVNVEWLDHEARTIRRELNGQHLTALPIAEEPAAHRLASRKSGTSSLVQAEGLNYALWLPNPTWSEAAAVNKSQLRIHAPLYRANANLFELDQLGDEQELGTATDAVERWLKLAVGPNVRMLGRHDTMFRGRPAQRLEASYRIDVPGKASFFRCRAFVFRMGKRWLVLSCTAPKADFKQLEPDFRRISQTVQLRRADFAPKVQGPLSVAQPR